MSAQVPPPLIDVRPGTMTTLVADLLVKPQTTARDVLIERALRGEFHDFMTKSATPKMDLDGALRVLGYFDLASLVRDGKYDEEPPTEVRQS